MHSLLNESFLIPRQNSPVNLLLNLHFFILLTSFSYSYHSLVTVPYGAFFRKKYSLLFFFLFAEID